MDSGKIMAFLQEHWCFAALVMGVLGAPGFGLLLMLHWVLR